MTEDKPPEAAEANNEEKAEKKIIPAIDLTNHDIKPDMFEGIHVLDDQFEKIEGKGLHSLYKEGIMPQREYQASSMTECNP